MQDASKEGTFKGEDFSKKDHADPSAHHADPKEKKTGKTNQIKFHHSFQLRTLPEGYNSGRQYIIQSNSEVECQELVEKIRQLAKVSTELYLAKSRFLKAQASPLAHSFRSQLRFMDGDQHSPASSFSVAAVALPPTHRAPGVCPQVLQVDPRPVGRRAPHRPGENYIITV